MKKLVEGLNKFKQDYFARHRELFEQLSHGQKPRVLFITCSDSRIDPNRLTNTAPGDLFVIRNAGNIIPPFGSANGGEGAAVEYAINALGIEQVVICGHSHCGAMKGLLKRNQLEEEMPLVYDWLHHAESTRRLLRDNYGTYSFEELLEVAIAENVLAQIENLKTYPIIYSRLYQNKLSLYGWVYLIETGEVLAYDPLTHSYIPPQSQLHLPETETAATTPPYRQTLAPPVTCDLPHLADQVAQPPPPPTPSREPTPTYGVPWLSAEQADRIYRGTVAH